MPHEFSDLLRLESISKIICRPMAVPLAATSLPQKGLMARKHETIGKITANVTFESQSKSCSTLLQPHLQETALRRGEKNKKRLDEFLAENKEHESKYRYWRVSIADARHFQSRCAVLPRILGLPLRTVEPDSDSAAIPPRRWAHLMQQRRPKQNNAAGKRHNVDKI